MKPTSIPLKIRESWGDDLLNEQLLMVEHWRLSDFRTKSRTVHYAAAVTMEGDVHFGYALLHPNDIRNYNRKYGVFKSISQAVGRAFVQRHPPVGKVDVAQSPKQIADEVFNMVYSHSDPLVI